MAHKTNKTKKKTPEVDVLPLSHMNSRTLYSCQEDEVEQITDLITSFLASLHPFCLILK